VVAKSAATTRVPRKAAGPKVVSSPEDALPAVEPPVVEVEPPVEVAGVKPFTWEPKNGGEPIVLPSAQTAVPKNKTMWFFYQMNKRAGNFVGQILFALECANVPESETDKVFALEDEEALELITAWAKPITGGASLGE